MSLEELEENFCRYLPLVGIVFSYSVVLSFRHPIENVLAQAWANYGPGATCGPLNLLIRPTELEEIKKINFVNP